MDPGSCVFGIFPDSLFFLARQIQTKMDLGLECETIFVHLFFGCFISLDLWRNPRIRIEFQMHLSWKIPVPTLCRNDAPDC